MSRLPQATLILSTLLASWLGMQLVHEVGHVLGAWVSGGAVARMVWHPLTISRTDLAANPHPLLVVWAGPLMGTVAPLFLWLSAAFRNLRGAFVLRFFAGFCLIANGFYIGVGSFERVGDCGDMLRHGSPIWTLWAFGLLSVPLGFVLWHRQATSLGIGVAGVPGGSVDRGVAIGTAIVATLLVIAGWITGSLISD
ncbi:MAG: hypothetical protein QM811_15280 [Pirellulales bacterium]